MSYQDYEEQEDWVHVDTLPNYSYIESLLKSLNQALYATGDIEAIEDAMDELNGVFRIRTPEGKPLLEMSPILWAAQKLENVKRMKQAI